MRRIAFFLASFGCAGAAVAGPYTEAGIAAGDARFVGWATGFQNLVRGPQTILNPSAGNASFGDGSSAVGAPGGVFDGVSLGDGGSITMTFATPIANGSGADFAVFENGFASGDQLFAELAFVEVSTNGVNFARFPSISLTPGPQVETFGTLDPTNVFNLAGKHALGTGTPFDLSTLPTTAGVDPNAIRYVRVIDVVGSIDERYGTRDSESHLINDAFETPFETGGFDLNAIGVINVPEPTAFAAIAAFVAATRRHRSV